MSADTLKENQLNIKAKERVLRKAKEKVDKTMSDLATATQELEAAKQDYNKALEQAKAA
jgi:t-SNARE complex subunit (syntaxin)